MFTQHLPSKYIVEPRVEFDRIFIHVIKQIVCTKDFSNSDKLKVKQTTAIV